MLCAGHRPAWAGRTRGGGAVTELTTQLYEDHPVVRLRFPKTRFPANQV